MSCWEIVKPMIYYSNKINPSIPNEIIRIIYSFGLIEDYKNSKVNSYIEKIIRIKQNEKLICIHLDDLPFKISKHQLKIIIKENLNKNNNQHSFSHYCCNGKGIVYNIQNGFLPFAFDC